MSYFQERKLEILQGRQKRMQLGRPSTILRLQEIERRRRAEESAQSAARRLQRILLK